MVGMIRWTARALDAIVLLVFLTLTLGEGPPALSALTTRGTIALLGSGIGIVGLIAAWWWEDLGGGLALGGFLLRALMDPRFLPRMLWALPVIGILFLFLGRARRRGLAATPAAPPPRGVFDGRLAGRLALGVAAVPVALLAIEVALPRPLMTGRATTIPAVAGRWEGHARVRNEWGPPGEVGFVLNVNGDGTASGTVGAAAFHNAMFAPNRSWLGGVFHLRSDYRLHGALSGAITPKYAILCAGFALPLNIGAGTLDGSMTALDCSRGGKKHGAMHTAPINFRKPASRQR